MLPSLLLSALLLAAPLAPDSLDEFIRAQMAMRKIPGLSLAIVDKGKVIYARGYGVTTPGGKTPVSTETLFLAGSISKSVSAMGALKLVEAGTLSLDEDVNGKLTTWKVPDNGYTGNEKVTLRRILSHTAGLTVHGFAGYEVGTPVPTLPQILDGATPANSAPVRVELRRMLADRVIATSHMTALLAEPEVNPSHAGLETFLTPIGRLGLDLPRLYHMLTLR